MATRVHGPTVRQDAHNRSKAIQALNLRLLGLTYEQIAQKAGYNDRSDARKAIQHYLKEATREPSEQVIQLELERLDMWLLRLAPAIRDGDTQSIATALKIQDRRAKYLGLDKTEARIADAAERQADASERVAEVVYGLILHILPQLGCTYEQQQQAPAIILENLDAALTTGQKPDHDTATETA